MPVAVSNRPFLARPVPQPTTPVVYKASIPTPSMLCRTGICDCDFVSINRPTVNLSEPRSNHLSVSMVSAVFMGEQDGERRTYPLLPRRKIEALIAEGRSIVIVDQHVLKVDGWLKYHPGGDKAIAHMVGRDATDEVTAFVSPHPSPRPLEVNLIMAANKGLVASTRQRHGR